MLNNFAPFYVKPIHFNLGFSGTLRSLFVLLLRAYFFSIIVHFILIVWIVLTLKYVSNNYFSSFFSGSKTPDKNYVSKREFSFTLEDDIYLRYLSFSTSEELQTEMVRRVPHKIDIGAVFNAKPSDHKKIANFQVLTYLNMKILNCDIKNSSIYFLIV